MLQHARSSAILDEEEIRSLISLAEPGGAETRAILERARSCKPLRPEEAAMLLNLSDRGLMEELYDAARQAKERVFGKRIVLFAPLYISNRCSNNCLYCGFRRENTRAERKTLTIREIVAEAAHLCGRGYRRLLLVAGEDPLSSSVDYLCEAVEAIYRETGIRIVHVNAAPMAVDEFSRLKSSGAGVYQCFQETYHRATYGRMHPSGPKSDYDWRLTVMDRAMTGGFDDVGMGALFGLYDYRFEVLSLIAHARHLEECFGVGPHTLSIPRLKQAEGAALKHVPSPVSDEDFKKIVAVARLSVPYAGVVISTREGTSLRDEVIHLGASQISAGSRTDIGGYSAAGETAGSPQFSLSDSRSLDEMIRSIMQAGLLPSLCTACYRSGRTGEHFRAAAEAGRIKELCLSNALLSLMEYLKHHAGEATRTEAADRIREILAGIDDALLRGQLQKSLERIRGGEEDLHL